MEAPRGSSRVVTVTPAPAFDRVYVVDDLQAGQVNRARHTETHLAGNGVNLARNLHAAGNTVRAVIPLNIEDAADLAGQENLFRIVPVPHRTRVNTVIIGSNGLTTNVNQAAQPLTDDDWEGLYASTAQEADRINAHWVVVGGALPAARCQHPRAPTSWLNMVRSRGARLCLDSPGPVIAQWLREGAYLDLISPNIHELQEAVGSPIITMGEAVDVASRMVNRNVGAVLLSLGVHGAVLVTPTQTLWARTASTRVLNTTGAGDAALAGLMSHWTGEDNESQTTEAISRAVRWGRAAVGRINSTVIPEWVGDVKVELDTPQRSLRLC